MHEPPGYDCPFCRLLRGVETEHNRLSDVVWQDAETLAFISPRWWPANPGHVIVVPSEHVENLYEIGDGALAACYATAKRIAIAMRRAYGCTGTSTRQHNEPGGNQDVWHFHVHVFPRAEGDGLYPREAECEWVSAERREPYAAKLRAQLEPNGTGLAEARPGV
jgi:histidine triad (HIT) family protein